MQAKEIERNIYSLFADIASSLGYSEVHGRIIAALLVKGGKLSLQELAKETGYSPSMVSLSLDFLEVFGIIKKVKKAGDRKLYVELQGNLLSALRKAFIMRLGKNVELALTKFKELRKELETAEGKEKEDVLRTLTILEKEVKRLQKYLKIVEKIKI